MIKPIAYREQKPMENKLIIRYSAEDLEATKRKGILFLDTSFNPNEHVCQVATIIGDNKNLNEEHLLFNGDYVLVQYLVGLDTDKRNMFYIESCDDGSEIRWCHISQVFCRKIKDDIQPLKNFVFCDLVKPIAEHYENGVFVMEKKQNTQDKAYQTKVRYIHSLDSEQLGLNVGDIIYAEKQSDSIKNVFGEELLRVPANQILGLV